MCADYDMLDQARNLTMPQNIEDDLQENERAAMIHFCTRLPGSSVTDDA